MQLIIFNELCARVHMSLAESVNSWKCGKAHYSIWCVCVCVSIDWVAVEHSKAKFRCV